MRIPKIISKNNHEYIFVKEIIKPPRSDLNVEKVKF